MGKKVVVENKENLVVLASTYTGLTREEEYVALGKLYSKGFVVAGTQVCSDEGLFLATQENKENLVNALNSALGEVDVALEELGLTLVELEDIDVDSL